METTSKQASKQSEDVQLFECYLMLDFVELLCEAIRQLQGRVAVLKGEVFTLAHFCDPTEADAVSLC